MAMAELIPQSHGGEIRHWAPGQSGNPGGMSKLEAEMVRRAREATPEAIDFYISVLRDAGAATGDRLKAANALLDRGFGKAR
jgi:hypothetical protein